MKILLVTSRYPWPPRRGDQMRAVQILDFLADEHEVTLLAPASGKDQPPPPANTRYRVELYRPGGMAIFSGVARAVVKHLPLQTGLFYQPDVRLVIAGDRPSPALRSRIEKAGARLIE